MPRLIDDRSNDDGTSTTYRLDCYYEMPGLYELTIGESSTCQPLAVMVDGKPAALERRAVRRREAGLGTSFPALPDRAGDWPVASRPNFEYAARIRTPRDSMDPQGQSIVIRLDRPVADRAPLVRWELVNEQWSPVCASYDLGPVATRTDRQGVTLGAPARINRIPDNPEDHLIAQCHLMDLDTGESLWHKDHYFNQARRGFRPGEFTWLGPLRIELETLAQWSGRRLALAIMPFVYGEAGPQSERVLCAESQYYRPRKCFVLCDVAVTGQSGETSVKIAPR
jgi:hypothetical protein